MNAKSGITGALLSPKTLREGRDAVRKSRRIILAVLAAVLSTYLWIIVVVSPQWSLTALVAALIVIPVLGVLGIATRTRFAALKVRKLQLICSSCGAALIDARGEIAVRDLSCAACGQVIVAADQSLALAADHLPTQHEFALRTDEWFITVGDDNDALTLVGGVSFVLVVVWLLARNALPEWTALIAVVVFAVPIVVAVAQDGRRRRWAERVGLYCVCGELLVEPGGPGLRRGVKAAMADLGRSRKSGTCWNCGRTVWRSETVS